MATISPVAAAINRTFFLINSCKVRRVLDYCSKKIKFKTKVRLHYLEHLQKNCFWVLKNSLSNLFLESRAAKMSLASALFVYSASKTYRQLSILINYISRR
jgi:hypothetical protein